MRTSFLRERRVLRARPESSYRAIRHNRRKYKGDLKQETGISLEMNDYDVTSLHIPYGPGWDARRIEKLVYQTVRNIFIPDLSVTYYSLGPGNELYINLLSPYKS